MSTSLLTNVINQFGGSGSIPTNLRAYLKLGAFLNWNGGVAEHDNNFAIPVSGNLNLSNFASPANRDFVSDNYTIGFSADNINDPLIGNIDYLAAGVSDNSNNRIAALGSALLIPTTWGTFGSRKRVGKATYGSTGQLATLTAVWDYRVYLNGSYAEGRIYVQMVGDQRRSGWGGTGTSGGTAGAAPTTVTISAAGQSPLTLNFSSSDVPLGTYNGTYNVTTWSWSSIAESNLKIIAAGLAGQTTFTTGVSIF